MLTVFIFCCFDFFKIKFKYFTDRTKAVLALWIFFVFSVLCLLCLCERLFICALWSLAWKALTSWLSFVVYKCKFVTFPSVSWVRCGTRLYRFLIFAPLLTLSNNSFGNTIRVLKGFILSILIWVQTVWHIGLTADRL